MYECDEIMFRSIRKSNSKRKEFPYEAAYKKMIRKRIENTCTKMTDLLPKHIHATNIEAFCLKFSYLYWFSLFCNRL